MLTMRKRSARTDTVRRAGALAGPVLVGALVLAGCGSDTTSGATASTLSLDSESTSYILRDPVTTTAAPVVPEEGSTAGGTQTYVVQSGDYAIKVADQFGVPLEELLNINGWASGNEFPFPGEEITIPPGGTVQGSGSTETAADVATPADTGDDTAAGAGEPVAGDTIPDVGSNCEAGSYTIVEGDYLGKVASKFDITVEAMNAANAGTDGYSAFYPGLKIVIPAKSDC